MADDRCDLLCLDVPAAEAVRHAMPSPAALALAAARAKALGDPTRLAVAGALAGADELCVCDLGWILGRSQNLVSHHLRLLREAGLATARRDGKMVLYSLTEAGRRALARTLEEVAA
jgi:DNA-binding transcriptional ArsR family regulator